METVKIIITDLDGTFVDCNGDPPIRNLEAVKKFISAGGYFTLATGRTLSMIKNIYPSIAELVNAPIITSNGALMSDIATEETIACVPLDGRYAASAMREAKLKYPSLSSFYVCNMGVFNLFDQGFGESVPSECWYKVTLRGAENDVDGATELIRSHYGCGFTYNKSSSELAEYLDRRTSKGKMLGKLREYIEAVSGKRAYIYALGDYLNDEDMLKSADFAACPSNSHSRIKSICDVVLCTNNDGAAADLIEKVIGIS